MKAKKTEYKIHPSIVGRAFDARDLVSIEWTNIRDRRNNDLSHTVIPHISALANLLLIEECRHSDLYKSELSRGYRVTRNGYEEIHES